MSKPGVISCAKALSLSLFLGGTVTRALVVTVAATVVAASTVTEVRAAGSSSVSSSSKSTTLRAQKPVLDKTTPVSSAAPASSSMQEPGHDAGHSLDERTAVGTNYGKPFGETIEPEAAASGVRPEPAYPLSGSDSSAGQSPDADGSTLAPFHRANNCFAPLRGVQLPRPLNIPRDASPALKEAASMISNMSVVSPNLIRGAQPTVPALSVLKSAGVKTIVNLRNEPILVAQEAGAAKRAGLNYINIPMALFETPTKQQFQKFLSAVDNNGPVFVHCQMGEDRTGTMVAVYRMAREGWDANRAYQEMTAMGFKTFLGSLKGAVFDYSAMLGRPARPPAPDFSGFASIFRH